MLLVGLTESSARFITEMIGFLFVAAILGWISQTTGISPLALLTAIFALFVIAIALILASSLRKPVRSHVNCVFIRANGAQCARRKNTSSEYASITQTRRL